MARKRRETPQGQVTFLAPDDAALLHLVRENLRLLSGLRSSYRPTAGNDSKASQVRCPQDVFDLLAPEMEALPQEQMRVVLLDSRNRVLDVVMVYQGNVSTAVVRTAEDTFYEIRCRRKLRTVALDARRKVIDAKARTLERQAARIEPAAVEDAAPALTIAEEAIADPSDDIAGVEAEIDWYVALASMPDEVARAIDLHYRADLKVHSNNPNEPTVSKILGCSERKARDLISKGEELARRQIEGPPEKEAP